MQGPAAAVRPLTAPPSHHPHYRMRVLVTTAARNASTIAAANADVITRVRHSAWSTGCWLT
jgi:hypothetical protein